MKKIYQSKTVMLAVAQAIVGILAVVLVEMPEVDTLGVIAIAKSMLDVYLRTITTETIDM